MMKKIILENIKISSVYVKRESDDILHALRCKMEALVNYSTVHTNDDGRKGVTPVGTEISSSLPSHDQPVVGMTTRVVRGGLWSLGGQGMTILASVIATPFIIRLLGSESYGVLSLINIVMGYLTFSDVGMGQASTR